MDLGVPTFQPPRSALFNRTQKHPSGFVSTQESQPPLKLVSLNKSQPTSCSNSKEDDPPTESLGFTTLGDPKGHQQNGAPPIEAKLGYPLLQIPAVFWV